MYQSNSNKNHSHCKLNQKQVIMKPMWYMTLLKPNLVLGSIHQHQIFLLRGFTVPSPSEQILPFRNGFSTVMQITGMADN
jgi:hypothetical protein